MAYEYIDREECIGDSLYKINNNSFIFDSKITEMNTLLATLSSAILSHVGKVSYFPSTVAPTGWLLLNGQTVSRSSYPNLWAFANNSGNIIDDASWTSLSAYGSFGRGDGFTTFKLPDLRGHFVRSSGTHIDGTAAGEFARKQNEAFKSHTHTGTTASAGEHTHTQGGGGSADDGGVNVTGSTSGGTQANINPAGAHTHAITINSSGGTETRPKNISLLACIKY
jgi:microcystin-dependent protein